MMSTHHLEEAELSLPSKSYFRMFYSQKKKAYEGQIGWAKPREQCEAIFRTSSRVPQIFIWIYPELLTLILLPQDLIKGK